ncbi:hypothetical protein HY772_03755 [Candidatus Woesearchaeota archaeon]|nr:hypothetical protein [Candidatus Woesearchaeota archaeon]
MITKKMIQNTYPVHHVVISASHDREKSPQIADEKILRKAQDDQKHNKDCISYNFRRAHGQDRDENKFLMPLYRDVPVLVFTVMPAVAYDCNVAVVGSDEVKTVVDALNDHLKHWKKRPIHFTHEGDKTSLPRSILAGAQALSIDDKTPFLFVAGDLPFFSRYLPLLYHQRARDHVGVYTVNAKQYMFPDGDVFIPRNFYHVLVDDRGNKVDWKESNTPILTRDIPFLQEVATELYADRQGGSIGVRQFIPLLFRQKTLSDFLHLPLSVIAEGFLYALTEILHRRGSKRKPCISHSAFEQIASVVMGGPFAIEFGDDVWRMKDIDAWHDLFFYQHMIHEAKKTCATERDGLDAILNDAYVISSFNGPMQEVKNSIGVLKDFVQYANQRAESQGRERPYDCYGHLRVKPASGENVQKALEHLIRYKAADAADRAYVKCIKERGLMYPIPDSLLRRFDQVL